jgi:hypothetical protein
MRLQHQSRLALCKFIGTWQIMQAHIFCYLRTVILSAAKDHDAWQSMQADTFLLRPQTINAYRDIDTRDHSDVVELKIAHIGVNPVS